MKISFHGAAQTVTGSKHLITLKSGKKVLLDCGLFQGGGSETDLLNRQWGFEPETVDVLVLSHAHIDHCGLIPKLIRDGFKGRVYCTPATYDLTEVLLYDSAHIQESDTKFMNKKRAAMHKPPFFPLYKEDDVRKAMSHFVKADYNEVFEILPGVKVHYTDAGHIVGSAAVHLDITENGTTKKITFTGDVGRYNTPILRSPATFRQADVIICESTYGDRVHDDSLLTSQQLLDAIIETCIQKKGKLIIPAFSVGRTQEILYALNNLEGVDKLPALEYYVDSPLSIEATAILKRHKECFNSQLLEVMKTDKDPFDFQGLSFIQDREDSQTLNDRREPMVIISASGMAEAGRVKHHISHTISDARNTILLVGYCEPNSLGGKLMRGAQEVKIFGELYPVNASIQIIRSFSAHGDYNDLSQFLACQAPNLIENFFVVHGEYETQKIFRQRLLKKGFLSVHIPEIHQEYYL